MFHVRIYTVVLGTFDRVCGNVAGQNRIFGVILEVAACESCSVIVHSRSVPAGYIHFISHLADAVTELIGKILVPGSCDHNADRETDGADAGKVVVDGSRSVAVISADFADAVDRVGLISAEGDHSVHVVQSHLIHELVPLGIIFVKAAHVNQLETVGSACRNSFRIGILIRCSCLCCQVIADVVEGCLRFVRHLIACGSRCGCCVVCEMIRTGQILDIACRVIKLVGSCDLITSALVVAVVGLCRSYSEGFGLDLVVGIRVDRNLIVACFKDISLGILVVIGHQLFLADHNVHSLGSAGLKHAGLLELNEVSGGLLNAAVGVRRVGIYFHDILTRNAAGIGYFYCKGDVIAVVGDITHLLCEGRIGQAVSEWILYKAVVIEETFSRCCLIETIADIDAFHIVYERRNCSSFLACEADRSVLELLHVGVVEVTEVAPPGSLFEVVDKCINCLSGRIDLACHDLAECCHTDVSAGCCPDEALDLRIVSDKAKLKCVGAVVNYDNILEAAADKLNQLSLAVVKLQIVVAFVPVIALIEGIVIGCCSVGCAVLIGAVDDGLYVRGKIRTFSAGTGDHDHSGVGECLRVRHHVIRISADIGLGKCPVLCPHSAYRAVCLVSDVEITQFGVGLNACVVQTLQKIDRLISLVQSTGSSAAQHRIGGSPAEYVELGTLSHGKHAFVLEKHCAFLIDRDREF